LDSLSRDDGAYEGSRIWVEHMRTIARRIHSISGRYMRDTLPPIKSAISRSLLDARAEIAEMNANFESIRRRNEERTRRREQRLEAAQQMSAQLRHQTEVAERRTRQLRRAAEEARARAGIAAENAAQARDSFNRARANAVFRIIASNHPELGQFRSSLMPSISSIVSERNAFGRVARRNTGMSGYEMTTGTNAEITLTSGEDSSRQAEGLILLAAIGTTQLRRKLKAKNERKKESKIDEEEEDERVKEAEEVKEEVKEEEEVDEEMKGEEKIKTEERTTRVGETSLEIDAIGPIIDISKLNETYPRPETGPLDERLQLFCSILAHLADDFEEELENDITYLRS